MSVTKEKLDQLSKRLQDLGVAEQDLIEKFILGSGKGGQKINKTSSCVYLKHIPTGIEIKCQQNRSREMNRFLARRKLCEIIEESVLKEKSKKQQAVEKIRRQKQRRTRKQKQKMMEDKKIQSGKKTLRQPPTRSDE